MTMNGILLIINNSNRVCFQTSMNAMKKGIIVSQLRIAPTQTEVLGALVPLGMLETVLTPLMMTALAAQVCMAVFVNFVLY